MAKETSGNRWVARAFLSKLVAGQLGQSPAGRHKIYTPGVCVGWHTPAGKGGSLKSSNKNPELTPPQQELSKSHLNSSVPLSTDREIVGHNDITRSLSFL